MDAEKQIREAANTVQSELATGFTESIYHRSLEHELSERGVAFSSEGALPIHYKGSPVGYRRPDMFVDDGDQRIVVELKSNSSSGDDQIEQYLKLMKEDENHDISKALLIRFNDDGVEIDEYSP